jgi:hypothetical protein
MTLDTRARAAGLDLLDRAASRPVPSLEPTSARRRRTYVVGGAVAAGLLVVAGLAVTRADDRVDVPTSALPTPAGVRPERIAVAALSASFELPSDWHEIEPPSNALGRWADAHGDVFVLADRTTVTRGTSAAEYSRARRDFFEGVGATIHEQGETEVDGRPAHFMRFREGNLTTDDYVVEVGDDMLLVFDVQERAPETQTDLRSWIASTLDITPADPGSLGHPGSRLSRPQAVVGEQDFAPAGLGAALQVPLGWRPLEGAQLVGFEHGIGTQNDSGFVLVSRSLSPAGRDEKLEELGATLEEAVGATVDGHDADIIRYRYHAGGLRPDAVVMVEYRIALDADEHLTIVIGNAGGMTPEVLDWIRSTIRID